MKWLTLSETAPIPPLSKAPTMMQPEIRHNHAVDDFLEDVAIPERDPDEEPSRETSRVQ